MSDVRLMASFIAGGIAANHAHNGDFAPEVQQQIASQSLAIANEIERQYQASEGDQDQEKEEQQPVAGVAGAGGVTQ